MSDFRGAPSDRRVDTLEWVAKAVGMVQPWGSGRHRVFVPQALGSDEFLRVTWHEDDRIVVFSQWVGDTCTSAIPVRITDATELAELLVAAVGQVVRDAAAPETDAVVALPPPAAESA